MLKILILLAVTTVCVPIGDGGYSCTTDDGQGGQTIVTCVNVDGVIVCS